MVNAPEGTYRKDRIGGFDCWLIPPALTRIPQEVLGDRQRTNLNQGTVRFALDRTEAGESVNLLFEASSGGWTYLFPIDTLKDLEELEDNLSPLLREVAEHH